MWNWFKTPLSRVLDRVVVLTDLPQPDTVFGPRILADDWSLSMLYPLADDRFAVIHFPSCTYFTYGSPNDEALGGHPLAQRGLTWYSVHEVINSSLIQELERRNRIHPRHSANLFKDRRYYVFTFKDSTLECVVSHQPATTIFEREEEAIGFWKTTIK